MSFYEKNFKDILVEQYDGVYKYILKITLNRPDASNAISKEMIASLTEVLEHADWDRSIRTVIITGAGKCFCAGGDLKAMEEKSGMFSGDPNELREHYMRGIQKIPKTIEAMQTPIIAMINGPAIGAGCDLASMCDLRVASDKAKFGETFTKLSLIPGDGGTFFLQRVIGYTKAMEMFLTGDIYKAHQAYDMGLVNKIAIHDNLENTTKSLAHRITSNGPISNSMIKKGLKAYKFSDLHSHLDLMATMQGITQRTSDHFTGLKAYKEKKDPEFIGY